MVQALLPKLKESPKEAVESLPKGMTYRSIVGSLLFISLCTRPDIATAVNILARHSDTYGPAHVKELLRVVGYLFTTQDLGVTYHKQAPKDVNRPTIMEGAHHPNKDLVAYCDADYAGATDFRSTSGYVIFMNGGPVTWSSRIQKLTAQSTSEAECVAACECVKEVLHLRLLLSELGYSHLCKEPTDIMEDNAACTAFAHNLKNRRSAKHYVVRIRFLQEQTLENKTVRFVQTPSARQISDILTKPLPKVQFQKLRDQLLGITPLAQK